VELRILGPTEVRHDGSAVSLPGAKPRQLLVLLAMRPNRPVPAEELIDELWDGKPPPSAATALRVHLARLRQVLELDRDPSAPSGRLPAGPHGYLLRVEPDELDVQRFERLIVLAREVDSGGDPGAAVPLLTAALDLWRGPALADARDLSATRSEITRLDELRIVAIEELADVRLALGEHALVIDALTAAVKEHPLRERLTESLMRALYRSDRQADALRVYAELARRLDDELGLTPSARLRRLEEDVLLQRPALDFVAPRTASAMPGRRWSSVRFIGRRAELGRLTELYHEAESGQRRAALVVGPPGIGKSTLVQEYCVRLRGDGVVPLVGYCDPDPAGDYQPVAEILTTLVAGLDDSRRSELPAVLRLLLPELAGDELVGELSGANAPGAHLQLFDAVANTLQRLAMSPIVLVIEDLHWADRPTLALLRYLLRHPRLDHVLVVATLRDDELIGERAELIERLAPRSSTTTLPLDGFGDHEVRALIRSAAPPETMPEIIDACGSLQEITGGNPYFLRELLRELDEEPEKHDDGERDLPRTLATLAPAGVRTLVDRRLDRLSDRGRAVLEAAAVLGRDVSIDLLASMCDAPSEMIFDALEESLATRLLVEDFDDVELYLFPHMLTRNAVYAAIDPERRVLLHRRAGEAIEQADVASSRRCVDLARHFGEAAVLGLAAKAAACAERAGDDAAARFAFAEAARWYEQTLRLRADDEFDRPETGRVLLGLGRAYANDGRIASARETFLAAAEYARRADDVALLADVALAADGPWSKGAEFSQGALPLLEEALVGIGDDAVRRVEILNGIASDLYYADPDREGELARQAVALAEQLHDPVASATAQIALHRWYTHQPEARRERLHIGSDALRDLVTASGPRELQLLIHRSLLSDLIENGMIAEFDSSLDQYERAAIEFGSPRDAYWAAALRSTQATLHGDLVAGEQLARGAALRGGELEQTAAGAYILQRFVVRFQQARLAEELANLRQVGGGAAGSVFRAGAALLAVAYAEMGQTDRAALIARDTLGPDGSALPRDVFWLAAVALFAGVAASAGDRELMGLVDDLLTPCAGHVVVFGVGGAVLGPAHYWLGCIEGGRGRADRALEHFAQATLVSQRMNAPFWAAESMVLSARVLDRRGRAGDANEMARLLRGARAIAHEHGYGRVLIQAAAFD
jgi:DNA-binding SARP family transcriptional activator/tetratricopeptide (TPR) repeat protein